jgi:hypothetical protein
MYCIIGRDARREGGGTQFFVFITRERVYCSIGTVRHQARPEKESRGGEDGVGWRGGSKGMRMDILLMGVWGVGDVIASCLKDDILKERAA